jgi:Protein of unknown function (DUF2442)
MANKWAYLLTDENLAEQIQQAKECGNAENLTEPRAETVKIKQGKIIIKLKNGGEFRVSHTLIQGLETATVEQLQDFWVSTSGDSIHWENLDVDFSVLGLLLGRFGTKRWMMSEKVETEDKTTDSKTKEPSAKKKASGKVVIMDNGKKPVKSGSVGNGRNALTVLSPNPSGFVSRRGSDKSSDAFIQKASKQVSSDSSRQVLKKTISKRAVK